MTDRIEELLDELTEAIEEQNAKQNQAHEGWYCINIKPLQCGDCSKPVCYIEPPGMHLIVVWKDREHSTMNQIYEWCVNEGMEPRIDTYHPILGDCIPFEIVLVLAEMMNFE